MLLFLSSTTTPSLPVAPTVSRPAKASSAVPHCGAGLGVGDGSGEGRYAVKGSATHGTALAGIAKVGKEIERAPVVAGTCSCEQAVSWTPTVTSRTQKADVRVRTCVRRCGGPQGNAKS